MKKRFKKMIAAAIMTAFVFCSYIPAYANETTNNSTIKFEQINIQYDEDGNLIQELVKLDDTYYYRVLNDEKTIAISLKENGIGDIAINTSTDNSYVDYGTFSLDNIVRSTIDIRQESIEKQFEDILFSFEQGDIFLTHKDLSTDITTTYAVPSSHKTLISQKIVSDCGELAECTNKFIASKSTSNIRASLYSTVSHRVTNQVNLALAKGLAFTTILTLCSLPTTILQAVLLLVNVAGTIVLANDCVLDGYNVTVSETKDVKCDGHVDYSALRTNRGDAAVANNNGTLSAAVELGETNETNVIVYDNNAMLDKGIENHKNLCL